MRGATLARSGALEAAVRGLRDPLIYPLFMADGWFVRAALPNRLAAVGLGRSGILRPLGLEPAVRALCRDAALDAARTAGRDPSETTFLLAAHGSPSGPRPRQAAECAARHIAMTGGFRRVVCGFVDEKPGLAEVTTLHGPDICLPFFATRIGHVRRDVPRALKSAGFTGRLLPPIGSHPNVPVIIARTLTAEACARRHGWDLAPS